MEICYLPVERLKVNNENLFAALSGDEYRDLKKSITKFGIQEPLIVTSSENGFYTVVSGNNRLRVAMEIGLETLPCRIIDRELIEGAIDTDIFRRHLTPQERAEYKVLKEKKCEEIFKGEIKRKLLPELFEKYEKGLIDQEFAISVTKLTLQQQAALLKTTEKPQPTLTEDEGAVELQEEISRLKEALTKKTQEIRELKSWKEENREKLEEKLAELEKKKSKVDELVRKEREEEVKNLMEVNEKLVSQIKTKQVEIDRIEEEKERLRRALSDREVELKAEKIQFAEAEQEHRISVITAHLNMVVKQIETIQDYMKFNLSKREVLITEEKIKNVHKKLDELSAHINKCMTP